MRLRNTPAYAGKTPLGRTRGRSAQETPPLTRGRPGKDGARPERYAKHPRLRGEDAALSTILSTALETPPLTRGRLNATSIAFSPSRNTPAYAGKTGACHVWYGLSWKHPRLRGEDGKGANGILRRIETPPLTRGRQLVARPVVIARGNTPAYAGKTFLLPMMQTSTQKHPRLRGEDNGSLSS